MDALVFPSAGLRGYAFKSVKYTSVQGVDIRLDIVHPEKIGDFDSTPRNVLLHYHGGFLVVGDRNAFYPHWLVNACASRGWIFITPDYRLLPESTASSSLEDAVAAYHWVLSSLSQVLGCRIGSVLMAGSSAGAYLALAVAANTPQKQPSALLLIYGMLDPTLPRYTTSGTNIFDRPSIETAPVLAQFPIHNPGNPRPFVSAYPLSANPATDPRFRLVSALHLDALFLDYMTGLSGLGRAVATHGPQAIPHNHRYLFPISFGAMAKLPQTFLLHGQNDSAVPVENSLRAAEVLRRAQVTVELEVPDDAEHGFDARAGNVNIEAVEGESVTAYRSLRKAISFLEKAVAKTQM
jgi:acetyl esterase/lipase